MSKVALITDLHFGFSKSSDLFLNNSMGVIRNEIIPYLKKKNIVNIYILGDLFDNRNAINIKIKNEVYKLFDEDLKDFNITMLIGNHDCFHKSNILVHSLKMFNKFHNVEVIEDVTLKEINNKKFLFVPWQTSYDDFAKRITDKNIYCDVAFMHADINGSYMNKLSSVVKDGLDQNLIFNSYGKVFSGHFHLRGTTSRDNSSIIYVGTPYELNRNDKNETKGFCILDTETLEHEFIDTKSYIKFVDLIYPEEFTQSKINNNIVDIHILVDKEFSDKDYHKYLNKINSYNPVAVKPIVNYAIVNSEYITNGEFKVKNTLESIQDYISNVLDLKQEDKENIYNKISTLYEGCRSL